MLNQIVLGPTVIAVIFAWNNLWQGKLSELPNRYKNDALPTLFTGEILYFHFVLKNMICIPYELMFISMQVSNSGFLSVY